MKNQIVATASQLPGKLRPDAAGCAGDEGHLVALLVHLWLHSSQLRMLTPLQLTSTLTPAACHLSPLRLWRMRSRPHGGLVAVHQLPAALPPVENARLIVFSVAHALVADVAHQQRIGDDCDSTIKLDLGLQHLMFDLITSTLLALRLGHAGVGCGFP